MCCTHDVPGFAPSVATVRSLLLLCFVATQYVHQKFSEGVAEILSMSYYNLTAHELSPSVVSALLNMMAIPASAVALYLLSSFAQYSPQVCINLALA
jgi:hypothetical protein